MSVYDVRDEVREEEQPRKMLNIHQVLELVPFSASTLFRLERAGRFPRGVPISGRGKAWFASEVAQWQRDLLKGQKR